MSFELTLVGPPHGKDRARHRVVQPKGKRAFATTYTPKETVEVEAAWAKQWEAIGSPTVEGPIVVAVEVYHRRKDSHFKTDGVSLSAEGRRHPLPDNQKPDLDNVLKIVMDALNGCAYKDDVAAVETHTRRFWTTGDERVRVWVQEADAS